MGIKEDVIGTTQLRRALNKSEKTIYNWRAKGMPYHKVAGRAYYLKTEVAAWIEQQEEEKIKERDNELKAIAMAYIKKNNLKIIEA